MKSKFLLFLVCLFFLLSSSLLFNDAFRINNVDLTDINTWGITSLDKESILSSDSKPLNKKIVKLGKKLFFEKALSGSNEMSCATCHDPNTGFSDGLKTFVGDMGNKGARRSPVINNLAWTPLLFWDGRASSLEEQAIMPIEAEREMNQNIVDLIQELQNLGYKNDFKKAFNSDEITKEKIAKAIADFERSLVSYNSPFDKYISGDKSAMSESQVRGMKLFKSKANCVLCHNGPNFTDNGFHDIGLDNFDDFGRFNFLPLPSQKFAFKTPGLRNSADRGPFMHNGSLETLRDVLNYYNMGGAFRDRPRTINMKVLNLTNDELADLENFIKALNGQINSI